MQPNMMQDSAVATSQEASQEPTQDLSKGYCVELEVRPGGFTVSDPQPLDDDADESADTDNEVPTLADAMKHIMMIVKSNPVGADEQAHMSAGYSAGRSM